MMDVQIPTLASAATSGSTNTQGSSRIVQGGGRREAAGSGKSFSSELHAVHVAKESRHEIKRGQKHQDEDGATTSSEQPEQESTSPTSSRAAKDDPSSEKTVEPAEQETKSATPSVVNDVTTQGVVLALIAQPAVKPDSQPLAETALSGPTNTALESVMPTVKEDGASLPVSAADSSKLPQIDNKVVTAKPTDSTATNPTGAIPLPAVDTAMQPVSQPKQEMILGNEVPPTPEEIRDPNQDKPTGSIEPAKLSQAEVKTEAKAESVVLPHVQPLQVPERQDAVEELTAQPVQRPEENRPVMIDRPVQAREARESKEDGMPQHLSVLSMAEQGFTNQDHEGGMEWSGRDHRDNLSGDQLMLHPAMTEISAPAVPSNFTLPVNGTDQRAFSSAPSAKLSADAPHAVATPPVQPTDWMPGNTTSQTKSMVLEVSQADLGRVNIRVAVNQDVVHTHFSSDRNDMGQYLQNGQDRLQSALQTSGLDLGRFQVDIDRQSAGRSFQQPASQGQSSNHSRQEESQNSGQGREEFTQDAMPRRGMLNLVA